MLSLWLVASCSTSGGLFGGDDAGANDPGGVATPGIEHGVLSVYLEMISDLVDGDPVTQAEVFQSVSAVAASSPNTTNRLKLALALSIPGHAGSNPEHAQRELRELLAASEVLLPEEQALAASQLAQVEQRLLLDLEVQRLQASAAAAAAETAEQQNSETELRLRQLEADNRALRAQLEETQRILDEITNIERSIRERQSAD